MGIRRNPALPGWTEPGEAVTNAYGVRMREANDHPTYTVDAKYACNASTWGGDHTCSCVYRKAVCDGNEHLCMCGSSWTTPTGPYTRCACGPHHEKENTPMATPVGIRLTAHQGDFEVEVSVKTNSAISPASVLDEQMRRAQRAFGILLRDDTMRPVHPDDDEEWSDD